MLHRDFHKNNSRNYFGVSHVKYRIAYTLLGKRMRALSFAFLATLFLVACAPKSPSGIYVGYADISGDRIKITLDLRSDGRLFGFAEQVSTTNPTEDPLKSMVSLLKGDEDGVRIVVGHALINSFKIADGRWKSRWLAHGVDIYNSPTAKEKVLTMKMEPDGDLTSELLRLSCRPGIEPVARLNVKDLKDQK